MTMSLYRLSSVIRGNHKGFVPARQFKEREVDLSKASGIKWTRVIEPAAVKYGTGSIICKVGHTCYNSNMERRMMEWVGDTVPFFFDYYKKYSDHKNEIGSTLTHRAAFCLPVDKGGKNELARFMRDDWREVRALLDAGKTLRSEELYEVHERKLASELIGLPGVYVNIDPEMPNRVYVGKAKDLSKRPIHTDAPMFMVGAFTTYGEGGAKTLEKLLHDHFKKESAFKRQKTRGLYILEREEHGVEVVHRIIRDHFPSALRNYVVST